MLITEDQIADEKAKIDSILFTINTLLIAEEDINYDSLLSRTLVNKNNFWSGYKEVLLGILNNHPDILKEPEPLVLFNDLGESSLDFRLLFWTDNYDKWIIIKSEVIFKVHDALIEAGIKIPFPQRDLHIKYIDNDKNV